MCGIVVNILTKTNKRVDKTSFFAYNDNTAIDGRSTRGLARQREIALAASDFGVQLG